MASERQRTVVGRHRRHPHRRRRRKLSTAAVRSFVRSFESNDERRNDQKRH